MYSVMLVDDERPARELLKMLVDWRSLGFNIITEAANGEDAIKKQEIYKPDLIITDIQMPTLDGLELIQNIRTTNPNQVFIMLSCHALFAYAQKAIKLGAYDYLIKDSLTPKELEDCLMQVKKVLPLQTLFSSGKFADINSYSPRTKSIAEYLLEHFHEEDIGLESLSKLYDIHKVHLARTFKEETGMSVHEMILDLRINQAKILLEDPEIKITEIIERIGYRNPQNFYTMFKRHTGLSPSEYRSNIIPFE